MVDSDDVGRGSIDDLPWASVFDPAANARALSAIQAEGFRAASQIVDRFVRAVGTDAGGGDGQQSSDGGARNGSGTGSTLVSDLEQLTRSWWSLFGQMLLRSVPGAAPASGEAIALDLATERTSGRIGLDAESPGQADAEIWLHNRSSEDLGEVALRCSDLIAHDGPVIPSGAVAFVPDVVPMPARCSRGVAMKVSIVAGARPGLYRGTVLAQGHPDLWLPVVLTVRPSAT